jgi:hypothetical protein
VVPISCRVNVRPNQEQLVDLVVLTTRGYQKSVMSDPVLPLILSAFGRSGIEVILFMYGQGLTRGELGTVPFAQGFVAAVTH